MTYAEYMHSEQWRIRRSKHLSKHPHCQRCGISEREHRRNLYTSLEVHHKTYERLGHERDADLETLCRRCHKNETWRLAFGELRYLFRAICESPK